MPLRVLHIVLDLHAGGLESLVSELVRACDPTRIESQILTLHEPGRFARGLEHHATVHRAPAQPPWSIIWPGALSGTIRHIAPDVVHTHSGVWHKASLAARLAGVRRLVHTDHGRLVPDPWHNRLFDRLGSRRTDVIVAVSEALARQLADTVVADPGRIRVVLNGVDTERFRPLDRAAACAHFGIPSDRRVVGSIGRFDHVKGYDILLDAFSRLLEHWSGYPRPLLVLAGEGPDEASLRRFAAARGIADDVRCLQWEDDVPALLATFDVFALASRSEGTSMSLLEAMSAGVCPVVTNVGGNVAVLGPGLHHRLVPPADPEAFAAACDRALRDPARLSDGQHARQRVVEGYSLSAMVRCYERIYRGEEPDHFASLSDPQDA